MSITPFPLPKDRARGLIREAANTKNTIIPKSFGRGEWYEVFTHRQVVRCLEDGEIVDGPITNEHGHFEYAMKRVIAGQEIHLTAVLFKDEHENWKVAVKEVRNGDY
jgi:hypothetical protein